MNSLKRMDEKIVIKYVDELVNDFLNSPFQDFTTNEFLNESQRFRTENMKKSERMDLEDSIMDFGLKKKLLKILCINRLKKQTPYPPDHRPGEPGT